MLEVKKFFEWCRYKMLTPIMEQVKINFQMFLFKMLILMNNLKLAEYYVRSVPTVIIEKDGKEVQRFVD